MSTGTLRRRVFERDQGVWQACGRKVLKDSRHLGHMVDVVVGGSDRLTNLVVMCILCNMGKPLTETKPAYFASVNERPTRVERVALVHEIIAQSDGSLEDVLRCIGDACSE